MSEGFNDLKVYRMSFDLAMSIFRISKEFPKEEKYSLTDQIRSGVLRDPYVLILLRRIEKEFIRKTSFQN